MAALEQIDTLRQQNRDLLKKLKKQSDKLRQLILLRVDAHCTPSAELHGARCASPTVEHPKTIQISDEYLSERHEDPTPDQHKHRQSSEMITHNTLLQDTGNSRWTGRCRSVRLMLPDSAPLTADSHQSVTDSAVAAGLETVSDRRIQPLLGYDWIAGLLDAESSLADRSEQFFSELRSFRQVNRDECVHNLLSGLPSVADLASSTLDGEEPQTPADTHQCTFCYRINSRLFAVPLDAQAACPVCKMPKIKHPHTKAEPALIRVSIPRSALLPAHQYKAHRRSSFDSSDSLSLPSHCLSGWSNPTLHSGSQVSSLDLRGSMAKPAAMRGSSSSWADSTLDSPLPSASRHPVQNVSRLPRYAFRHLDPTRPEPHSRSYTLY